MIYEGVFFSFDLVLSLVAVLIVPVLFEKRGVRAGYLSPWLDPRPLGWGALAGRAEILDRSPPSPPFWHTGARLFTSWGGSGSLFCWKRIVGVPFRTIFIESSFIAHCKHFYFILIVVDIIWSCRLHSRLSIRDCGFIFLFWSSLWWRGCFIWKRCISTNWIFWSDFI